MGSFRQDMLGVAADLRTLTGPDPGFDVRPYQLTIITRVWSGGFRGSGTPTNTPFVVPQIVKMKRLKQHEIAGSGGKYEMGDILFGPFTPAFPANSLTGAPAGGFTEQQIAPRPVGNGTEIIYSITGQHAGEYVLVELRSDKSFRFELVLRRSRTTPVAPATGPTDV